MKAILLVALTFARSSPLRIWYQPKRRLREAMGLEFRRRCSLE
jgi:hypothetical protein